ncbi:MAG: T9SS type A sorting domain-containing protein [Saprospiraceae bacterium]|nr:T9SS type A sorting domain-containing protein [Saprospiraceae bacterium]
MLDCSAIFIFNLEKSNYNSNISFSTASETNNDYFTIERSGDGRSFESIGEIKGAGNSNQELSYEFVDESPLAGINYYRIKQTDFDGAYSYTEIRSVRHQTKNVIVSPNRTDGKLNVTSELDNYDVVIYNTGGQEVQRHMALSGDQSLSIETLQAGVYFVKVMDQTIRILKF